jgi:hypothetical protein
MHFLKLHYINGILDLLNEPIDILTELYYYLAPL